MTDHTKQTDTPFSDEAFIILRGGLRRFTKQDKVPVFVDIQLDFKCNFTGDQTLDHNPFYCDQKVWGYGIEFNQADHEGQIITCETFGSSIRCQVAMRLNRDKWSGTGIADYEIELKKQGNNLKGKFRGYHNSHPVAGEVFGILRPLAKPNSDFVPVQPGEHPRLLFRKQDLPALKTKARSSIGKKLIVALNAQLRNKQEVNHDADDAIGYGLLYQIQGDTEAGELARKALQRLIQEPVALGPHDRPITTLRFAIAYDLIYDICDRHLQKKINHWLNAQASLLLLGTDRTDFNPTPWSNWNGMYRSALGTIALTLLGEPSEYVPAPIPPVMRPLPPSPQCLPGQIPTNPLELDKMPTQWLFAGPFHCCNQEEEDILASIGGISVATPQVGTEVTYRGITHCFQLLPPKYIWSHPRHTKGRPLLDIANPVDQAVFATAYYYTTIENKQPRWLQVGIKTPYGDAILYIGGQRLTEGDAIYLEKGIYPLFVEAKIEPRSGWGENAHLLLVEPRLMPITPEGAKASHMQRLRIYKRDYKQWQAGYEAYLAVGKINPTASQLNMISARSITRFLGTALGEWGWNSEGEHYTQMTMELLLSYIHSYQNVMGVKLLPALQLNERIPQPQNNLRHFLPLYIAKSLYRNSANFLNLESGINMNNFGGGNQPLGNYLLALGFNTAADIYKPALLWVWNLLLGLDRSKLQGLKSSHKIAFTLINYPLEMQPKHPSQVLPLVIQDSQKGGYIFRNRWQDENDIIAQIYLKSDPRRASWSYIGDGAFRIDGLGHSWAVKGGNYRHHAKNRTLDNVVQLSEPINGWLGGQTSYFQGQTDGSGTVSINLNNAYLGKKKNKNGKGLPLADLSARILHENTMDLGIQGMRAFAVDYSGAANVPALFVVVDKISGGKHKSWQMIISKEHKISIQSNIFTVVAEDGATLRGTFIVPANVEISKIGPCPFVYKNLKGELENEIIPLRGIQAQGGNNFFVVMTLQKSSPPAVAVSGTGLTATVTIGNQTIRFVEDKIVVGQCKT